MGLGAGFPARPAVVRPALGAAALAWAAAHLAHVTAGAVAGLAHGALRPSDVVLAAATGTGALAAAVLATGCALLLLASTCTALGRTAAGVERAAAALTPRLLRRVLTAGLSASLGLGAVAPAVAAEDLGWPVPGATDSAAAPVESAPGPFAPEPPAPAAPERPTLEAVPAAHTEPVVAVRPDGTASASQARPGEVAEGAEGAEVAEHAEAAPEATVTVRPGDTLWDLAAAHLPAGASDTDVAAAWPRWHAANLAVVGADPDLIHPGQVLVVPPGP